MINGFFHGLKHSEHSIILTFGPSISGTIVAMKPRPFSSQDKLADFLTQRIGVDGDDVKDFLMQLDSTHHATMKNEVRLSEERYFQLGL